MTGKNRWVNKILAAALTAVIILTANVALNTVNAASLSSSYQILKNDPANQIFIQTIIENGATEGQIESFLNDLDSEVAKAGTITAENFDSVMYNALREVITWRKHRDIFKALLEGFTEEIDYTLENHELHPNLIPLRNAVRDSVLGISAPPPSGGDNTGGNTGGGGAATPAELPTENQPTDISPAAPITVEPVSETAVVTFEDIEGHWAQNTIEKMTGLGIVSGMSANQFAPERSVTRAEFAALLVRALDIKPSVQLMGRFNDVPADKWYFSTVNTAASAGLISGYSNSVFGPDDLVTREQMAIMISKALAYKGQENNLSEANATTVLAAFRDNNAISPWAASSVAQMVGQEIMRGRGNAEFAPRANATRAEATVLIHQMTQHLKIIP